jgi:hypothetical protein
MSVNWVYPAFDNSAIRRALMGAIDQTDFVTAVAGTVPAAWWQEVPGQCAHRPPSPVRAIADQCAAEYGIITLVICSLSDTLARIGHVAAGPLPPLARHLAGSGACYL